MSTMLRWLFVDLYVDKKITIEFAAYCVQKIVTSISAPTRPIGWFTM